ncbi:RidA family protein [Streptomyces sp. NBC_01497]|uniref:RidA family protein n=1 Tax=Streptomyces sp. NBC_01497 TaxID=2903885 RepID=UPI002E2EC7CC|nr:RidA family protein [Streptomyces sp. NBC_01497]
MSDLTHVTSPGGVAPGSGYSHVVLGTGTFVAVSGQCAFDGEGRIVGEGDPAVRARRVFENLRQCLAVAGAGFDDVVKPGYGVGDVAQLPAVRAARGAALGTARPPARSAVQVAAPIRPAPLVEIDAFAVAGGGPA